MKIKATVLALFVGSMALSVIGCKGSEQSDLNKEDRQKMDTLFREGIKNTPDTVKKTGGRGQEGKPLNAADE